MKFENFSIILRNSGSYINISQSITNQNNVVEINNIKYNISENQYIKLKSIVAEHISSLQEIAQKQTPSYLDEYALDGYVSNITIETNETSVYVNFAVNDNYTQSIADTLITKILNLFTKV